MATIPTNPTPTSATEPEDSPRSLSRLWQLPFFLLALGAFLFVYLKRPLLHQDSGPRLFDRDLAAIRTLLTRSASEVPSAVNLAERALTQVSAYPSRAGEVAFLLGSGYLRLAETLDNPVFARERLVQARQQLELALTQEVPEIDRPRLQVRLAKALYLLEDSPGQVVHLLSTVADRADDPAEAYQMLSRAYLRLPQPDLQSALQANERLRQVPLASEEILSQARLEAGELLMRLSQPEEARKVLQLVTSQAPADVQSRARWLRAQSLQDEGRFDLAANLWQEAAADTREPRTNRARIYFNLGYCYRRLDQPADAVRAWEDCLQSGKGPEQQAAGVLLAELQLQEKAGEKALETFTGCLRDVTQPGDWKNDLMSISRPVELSERAIATLGQTQRELGLRWAQVFKKIAPPGRAEQLSAGLLATGGRELLAASAAAEPPQAAGLKEQATRQLRDAAMAYADSAAKHADLAVRADMYWSASEIALQIEDRDNAVQWLTQLIQLFDPPAGSPNPQAPALPGLLERKARAWYLMAETLRQSNSPKAEEAYRNCRATSVAPFCYRALYQLAMYSLKRGEVDDAVLTLNQNLYHLRFHTDKEAQERSLFALGGIYYSQSKYQEVVRILEEALGRFPANPEATRAHLQLAQSYRQLSAQQNLTKVENMYKAEETREHFAREHRRMLTKAAAEFTELARFLESPESAGHLTQEERIQVPFIAAECRFDLGQYEEALAIYEHLADRHKGTEDALNALGGAVRCHAAMGQAGPLRQRLAEIRGQLTLLNDNVRTQWEEWLTVASKPIQPGNSSPQGNNPGPARDQPPSNPTPEPTGPGQPEAPMPEQGSNKPMSPYQQRMTGTAPNPLEPGTLQPGQLQPTPVENEPLRINPNQLLPPG